MGETAGQTRLAVDIGGTFTDVVLDGPDGFSSTKQLTTHGDPAAAVIAAASRLLEQAGIEPGAVDCVIHGTTLGANIIIERRGARTALLVTEGHRDTLETAYENRFDQYDLAIRKAPALVPRRFRWPVRERMAATGDILLPLDEASVVRFIDRIKAERIESVAVGLLHSYANPAHEQRVAGILRAALPDLFISLSAEISPQIREYDRLSTAAANAYIQPLVGGYLAALETGLKRRGFDCPLLMVMSSGGLTTVETAGRFPVRLVESGPAGGAILAADIARRADIDKVVSFDMGGTTAKLCLIENGRPTQSGTLEVDRLYRYIKGSGIPLRIPSIEMVEIGAGGGSMARIDELQRLRVGPQSAGSEPGPACYARGGGEATVTDADLLLGHISAADFAAGQITLSRDAAHSAVQERVAALLQLDATEAAAGINDVVNEAMANAARVHAVESGRDIAQYTLVAFGGAAPLHAGAVADKLGIRRIIIPHLAGVGSAMGFLLAPISFEHTRSWVAPLHGIDARALQERIETMTGDAAALVHAAKPGADLQRSVKATMRYSGQGHEVDTVLDSFDVAALRNAFENQYRLQYGRLIPGVDIELVTLVVRVGETSSPGPRQPAGPGPRPVETRETQYVYVDKGRRRVEIACYRRGALQPGHTFKGPAVIREEQTATLVPDTMRAGVNGQLDIIMEGS